MSVTQMLRQKCCGHACVFMCNFRADNGNPGRRLCDDVTKIPLGQLVCHFLLRVQEAADETYNSQRAWRPREDFFTSGTCEGVCDGGGGSDAVCVGGHPLQVWTYLASGYSDDKLCEQRCRGSDSGIQRETCLCTVRLNSVCSLTTNPPASPPPGHCALVWHDQEANCRKPEGSREVFTAGLKG